VEAARFSTPRLTTVRQADEVLARRGAEILLSQIERASGPVYETVAFRLLPGESVRELQPKEGE
jgi:Transcriptional regulators